MLPSIMREAATARGKRQEALVREICTIEALTETEIETEIEMETEPEMNSVSPWGT